MPFDTTYHVSTYDENVSGTIILPGGKDILIALHPWQLPSQVDSALAGNNKIVRELQNSLAKDIENGKQYVPGNAFIFVFITIFVIIFLKARKNVKQARPATTVFYSSEENSGKEYYTYYGNELDFSNNQLEEILTKRSSYYTRLAADQQLIFLQRLKKFIACKTFKIHGEKKYKEMPVLISAAAIQLTFGLKKYLLPYFKFIHIYPQEFLRVHPILCFLEGNVSGHAINLSWKHFLDGYENPNDGLNVGLHELAHALYYQTFEAEENVDKNFRGFYDSFNVDGNKAYNSEKTVTGVGLYSEYAEKNFQEFWAESVELFFEKPAELRKYYPDLYQTMKSLLNQDPLAPGPSPFC